MRRQLARLIVLNVVAALQAHAATYFVPDASLLEQQLTAPLPQRL
jgi:hypothetical protein